MIIKFLNYYIFMAHRLNKGKQTIIKNKTIMKATIKNSETPKRNLLLAIYVIGATVTVATYSFVVAMNTLY